MRTPWSSSSRHQQRQHPTAAAWEAEENARSILDVPLDQLPDGPARAFLLSEAMAGKDVNAYRPIGSTQWNVWYGPLAPRYDARSTAANWHTYWQDYARLAAEYAARQGGQS